MQHYINAWKNYAVFKGRASRKEYWLFVLFNIIFATVFSALDIVLSIAAVGLDLTLFGLGQTRGFTPGFTFFYIFYLLAMLIPGWAYVSRRLHDIGKSGWMQLIALIPLVGPIWLLVLLLTPSVDGETKYDQANERRKTPFLSLVKVVLIVSLVGLLFSGVLGGFLNTSSNLVLKAFFNLPTILLTVAACVIMILAFMRSKEEGRTTPAFWAAFVLFWVHFFLLFTTGIQISLFKANSTMIITQVNTVVGMAATTILFLLLFAEIQRNGGKRSGILLLLSLIIYLLGIFLVPFLAGLFRDNAPDTMQLMSIAQIVTFLIAAVLLGLARIHEHD